MPKTKSQTNPAIAIDLPARPSAPGFLGRLGRARLSVRRLPFWEAVAVIVGTIIGAGVLGIPYAFAHSGFWISTLVLVVVAVAVLVAMLFMGELVLRTPARHQLPGYIGEYLGRNAKFFQAAILIFSIYGALLAYTIGQGEVLSALFGGSKMLWSLLFFGAFSYCVVRGLGVIKRFEIVMVALVILAVAVMWALSNGSVSAVNWNGFDIRNIFLPYGVIMFALYGLTSIPQARQILGGKNNERTFRYAVVTAALIPPVVYFIFALLVVGVTGINTTEVATVGLGQVLGPGVVAVGNILAFLTMGTSFLALGLAVKQIYQDDFGMSPRSAAVLTLAVPPVVFLLGARDFIQVIGIVGALGTGITCILGILAFWRARQVSVQKPKTTLPNWLVYGVGAVVLVIFALGAASLFIH